MSFIPSSMWGCGLLVCTAAILCLLRMGCRPKGLPPGPPTVPFFGNLLQMPTKDVHIQFSKWADLYGPVYSLILGSQVMIVLNSDTAVKDLIDKRSNIYSDRPESYVGGRLCSGNLRMLFMPYGPTWRLIRKLSHNLLNATLVKSYLPYQSLESKAMLMDFLAREVQDPLDTVRRFSNSVTTSIVYGWRNPTFHDDRYQRLFTGFDAMVHLVSSPAAAFMDYYPILRRLPDWACFVKREAKRLHAVEKDLYVGQWLQCKEETMQGTARPSFCKNMARVQEKEGLSDDLAAYQAGTLLEAGSDTTSSTLYGFIQAMVVFPDAQKKAQEEIDRVIGPDRLPTWDDAPNMPYVRACVKESLRWMPTTIFAGNAHAVIQDDEYMGYRIPKGAAVLINVWAINMNPHRHPSPRTFDPSRYLTDPLSAADAAAAPDVARRDHFTFGAGRRVCQGMHVAERSLFLAVAHLLWAFAVRPVTDGVLPDTERLVPAFVTMPERFEARFVVRDAGRAEKVRGWWREVAEGCLDGRGQWKAGVAVGEGEGV